MIIKTTTVGSDSGLNTQSRHVQVKDATTPVLNPNAPTRVAKIPTQRDRVFAYKEAHSRSTFEPPEYDFNEVLTVEDTESYFARSIDKKANLMFKEGWSVTSANEETQTYIDTRLAQLEAAQNRPWHQLFKETARDLFRFSNAIWIKVRDISASGGYRRTLPAKGNATPQRLDPVAAYFIAPMETLEFKKDSMGKVTHVRQHMTDGRKRTWPIRDVVHFHINRKSGWTVGTPGVVPAIDDIRTLRRMEENIDLLVYQNLFPRHDLKG